MRLSGWVHSKRDHGGLLFIDLRDHYGITQLVFPAGSAPFAAAEAVRPESVITATGTVTRRLGTTVNPKLPTGEIEIVVADLAVQSEAAVLPMQVAGAENFPDELRLRYRYLDLRRDRVHRNMMLRAQVIASIRRRMIDAGFMEFQTPILTASSPEGCPRFPGPRPHASRQILRPSPGAAAIQAIAHGRGASTGISRSRLASGTKPAARIARQANSTSSISK